MARTTSDIVIDAPAHQVMAVIADFDAYPDWATGMKEVRPLSTGTDGRPETVSFVLDAAPIRDSYVLRYDWQGDREVSWSLAEPATILRSMDGSYVLEDAVGATRVTYQLAVDVSIPLLGMLKRKAEKVIIDTALRGLKARVEGRP
jgi:uncharacterized membrane protein